MCVGFPCWGSGEERWKNFPRITSGQLEARRPKIIMLVIGSNDLCDASWDLQTITESIQSCRHLQVQNLNLEHLVYCGVLPRVEPHVTYAKYNVNVPILNDTITEFCRHTPKMSFWKHEGFVNPVECVCSIDGIHMNGVGNYKFFKSYRGAILLMKNLFI